ncbi:MaoC family dehydratase N-terminal domain-containing protein [Thermopolyspora sp. NPDC052614]|uniref:FAS1-like dehydratase domain-containing protein n=1 Tax=Thermopolyspora sp. NPDC052614 TaxID=3155682 RepID=UPI00343C6296
MGASSPSGLSRYLESWRPEPVTGHDIISAGPVAALSAVLDLPKPAAGDGEALPPLWHWLYFLDWVPHRELGPDGHPLRGHFLPPIPNRARMIAGGRIDVRRPLLVGAQARRRSTLADVAVKQGRSGEMAFVTVRHEISQDSGLCLIEEHDVVYRSIPAGTPAAPSSSSAPSAPAATAEPPPGEGAWRLSLRPDSPLLFRFSALTANAHRIHYDEPYVRDVEGFPGLIVHGPLLAMLMLEPVRREVSGERVRSLSYRLRRPVFLGDVVHVVGGPVAGDRAELRVDTDRGSGHATAEVTFTRT